MLRSIQISNFQKHKKLKIDFDKITTILGPNDRGKSAIFRAIRWLTLNTPSGKRFIRHGADNCSVVLVTDKNEVKKTRAKSQHYYVDGKKLSAFGRDVPKQVKKALRIDETNFQNQLDGPYWFSLSSNELTKKLNEIVDLTYLDEIQKESKKRIQQEKTIIKYLEDENTHLAKLIKQDEWVVEAKKLSDQIKKLQEQLDEIDEENDRIEQLIKRHKEIRGPSKDILEYAEQLKEYRREADSKAEKFRHLENLVSEYTKEDESCQMLQDTLRVLKSKKPRKLRCPHCSKTIKPESLQSQMSTSE